VIGVDADARRVAGVNAGASFIEDVAGATLQTLVTTGRLPRRARWARSRTPTPSSSACRHRSGSRRSRTSPHRGRRRRGGDDPARRSARGAGVDDLSRHTQEILLPRFAARGFDRRRGLLLAFSPERIDPGNRQWTLRDIPKVVGGLTPACRELVAALYARITPHVVPCRAGDGRDGQAVREHVPLGQHRARQRARDHVQEARDLGVEVVTAAATKPFGFMPFWPGRPGGPLPALGSALLS